MAIRIDYTNVKRRANQIEDAIHQVEIQRNRVKRISDNLPSAWQGIAAEEFRRKLYEFDNELVSVLREMYSIHYDILKTAHDIQAIDKQLASEISHK